MAYMGASQFKAFQTCPAAALAACRGEYQREMTKDLLMGSYVDAHFSQTLDLFMAQNPQIFYKNGSGKLLGDYEQCNEIIARIERDPMAMYYFTGRKQVIMTGVIAGVPFKIKIDCLGEIPDDEFITDGKLMKDFNDVWVPGEGYQPFIEAWGYDIQGAIYQEITLQVLRKRLPFIINAATKEKVPDIGLFSIPQSRLDEKLDEVIHLAPEFSEMKLGLRDAPRCGHCDYCKATKVLSGPVDYRELIA
jgi:hypothetical protein